MRLAHLSSSYWFIQKRGLLVTFLFLYTPQKSFYIYCLHNTELHLKLAEALFPDTFSFCILTNEGREGGEEGDLCQAKVFPGVSPCHSHYLSWSLPLLTSTCITAFLGYCQRIKARIQALQRQQGVSPPGVSALEDPRLNLVPVGSSVCTGISHIFTWGLALNSHHSWGSLLPWVCSERSTVSSHSPLLGHSEDASSSREGEDDGWYRNLLLPKLHTSPVPSSQLLQEQKAAHREGRQAARDEQLTSAFSDTGKAP